MEREERITFRKMFEAELSLLKDLLKTVEERDGDGLVLEILGTWHEMLVRFPLEVSRVDIGRLDDFLTEKAQNLYKSNEYREGSVMVEENACYSYNFGSVSLVKDSYTLLYPFMLVRASNYEGLVSNFCQEYKKAGGTLAEFHDLFLEFDRSGRIRTVEADIKTMKKLLGLAHESREDYKRMKRLENRLKRVSRLYLLKIMNFYHAVNFPVLGLVPYMHATGKDVEIPGDLGQLVEIQEEQEGQAITFRLFLVPVENEKELVAMLRSLGLTGRVEEWTLDYNWEALEKQARKGDNKARNDSESQSTCYGYKMIEYRERVKTTSPAFLSYLEAVHRYGNVNPLEVAYLTGYKQRTVLDHFYKAVENKAILPYWNVGKIGLGDYCQVMIANDEKARRLIEIIKGLPKTSVMRSREFYRIIMALSNGRGKKVDERLTGAGKRGELAMIAAGKFRRTVNAGVDLTEAISNQKRRKQVPGVLIRRTKTAARAVTLENE
ncbi:MAG: hypothetical protein ACXAEU_19625 [Candidatus Hodarchaeales archaeon]